MKNLPSSTIRLAALALPLLAALSPDASIAADLTSGSAGGAGAQQAKAKFEILLAAGLYTHWPASAPAKGRAGENPLELGVVGRQDYAETLDAMASSKTIAGRRIIIRRFESAADVEPCQILFITSAVERADRQALIHRFATSPMLLAGESAGFCREGGGLSFETQGGQVKFVLNPAALAQQKLRVDPRFSRLASNVMESGHKNTAAPGTTANGPQQPVQPRPEKKIAPPHPPQPDEERKAQHPPPPGKQPQRRPDISPHPPGKRP